MKDVLRLVVTILLGFWMLLTAVYVDRSRCDIEELITENENQKVQIEELTKNQEDVLTLLAEMEEATPVEEEPIDKSENVAYDYNYVVSVIAGECGDEPYEGQVAVAQVVLNRSKEWGMTPEEVVRQPGQFIAPPKALGDIREETWKACEGVFFNGEAVTDANIKWFCAKGTNSAFHNSLHHVFTIGNHNFYE